MNVSAMVVVSAGWELHNDSPNNLVGVDSVDWIVSWCFILCLVVSSVLMLLVGISFSACGLTLL